MVTLGIVAVGVVRESRKLSARAPICRAHCAVIFAIAQLSCFTSHDYVYVADVECQVMFSLVTLYCFMCNIGLVTFFGLQY